jgi:cation transport ATPase
MRFEIRHSIKGRIRLRIPALKNNSSLAGILAAWLTGLPSILQVRVNLACCSVVVDYRSLIRQQPMPWLKTLTNITPQRLRPRKAAQANKPSDQSPASKQRKLPGPLTIATAALGLSLIPNAAALTIPLVLWTAVPSWRHAFIVVTQERRLNVDFLDGLAVVIAVARAQMFTAAFMVWLITLGDWIRDRTAAKSKRTMTDLLAFQGRTAWLLKRGRVTQVPAMLVKAGNIVIVYPGELIPVDGLIMQGTATVDQRMITGESLPLLRSQGIPYLPGRRSAKASLGLKLCA